MHQTEPGRTCAWKIAVRRCRPVVRCDHDGNAGANLKDAAYRFVIADDHPLFRGALREALARSFDDAAIAEAGSSDEVLRLIDRHGEVGLVGPDLVMLALGGFLGMLCLRAQSPEVPG